MRILGLILGTNATRRALTMVALAASGLACDDDPRSHVYVASHYRPAEDCFGPSTPLAEVSTPNGDLDCAPACLVLATPGGSADIYVSTMCAPYPPGYDTSHTDPGCPAALAAWPAEEAAYIDGTSSCAASPASPTDGGGAGPTD